MCRHATKSKKIGFIAARPIPRVLINVNSFALGARSVDPTITTQVIFTGEWSMPVKEAMNSLADQKVDAVTCHVGGPKVIMETVERQVIRRSKRRSLIEGWAAGGQVPLRRVDEGRDSRCGTTSMPSRPQPFKRVGSCRSDRP